jgi:hypothetical protein
MIVHYEPQCPTLHKLWVLIYNNLLISYAQFAVQLSKAYEAKLNTSANFSITLQYENLLLYFRQTYKR